MKAGLPLAGDQYKLNQEVNKWGGSGGGGGGGGGWGAGSNRAPSRQSVVNTTSVLYSNCIQCVQ